MLFQENMKLMPSRWLPTAKSLGVFLFAGSARMMEYQKKQKNPLKDHQRRVYSRLTKRGPGGLPEEGPVLQTY